MKGPLIILSVLLAAAPAFAQPQRQQSCLHLTEIDDFKGLPGGRSILVLDNLRQRFVVTFTSQCNNLGKYANLVFVGAAPGRLGCAVRGDTVLSRAYGGPPDRCIIKSIEPYDGPVGDEGRLKH